jgi:serine/threonine-protein kinase HipA
VPRPNKTKALAIWMNGERVGTWVTNPTHPDEFEYDPAWLKAVDARPMSLSLPLSPVAYKGPKVTDFFDNLLPENRQIRQRLQRRYEAQSTKAFDLLYEIGRDCVGAIQLLPEEAPPPEVRSIEAKPLSDRDVAGVLRNLLSPLLGRIDTGDFRISLAGAQEKTALLQLDGRWHVPLRATPSTHILKLPIGVANQGIDLSTSVENEWLCAQVLREYGVPVAPCQMAKFDDQRCLIVERFDRRLSSHRNWIVRLPQEDFCQATGTAADDKYQNEGGPGIRRIMDILLGSSEAEADRLDFFRTQILFWMLCAIDGHAKNFSVFLEGGGAFRLTPRYDVLSAYPVLGVGEGKVSPREVKMAMAVQGSKRSHYEWHNILPRHWEETARRCGVGSAFKVLLEGLVERTPAVVAAVHTLLPKGFPAGVSEPILRGLEKSAASLAKT